MAASAYALEPIYIRPSQFRSFPSVPLDETFCLGALARWPSIDVVGHRHRHRHHCRHRRRCRLADQSGSTCLSDLVIFVVLGRCAKFRSLE